ncbi:hypothetical protein H9639_05365 [Arthrobacter sp. Sa2CUA1]|uniref:Uncharacterized protein n=1 Tax=Arthrobacter gallicola TaxID=2762225 RepID=A0ABR8UQB0_9MICC|nr:hypothetical protein [Arthrobacter gallicola]
MQKKEVAAVAQRNELVLAADQKDLGAVLGCSEGTVEDMRDMGYVESRGELWSVGPARDYLRDAAWADGLWD